MRRKPDKGTCIYLDSYVLQKDMRIRMPKEIVENLDLIPGISFFDVFLDTENREIILKLSEK